MFVLRRRDWLSKRGGLDFGAGFYLTTNEEQAVRFSDIVFRRRGNGTPIVSIYEFDMESAEKTLSICPLV